MQVPWLEFESLPALETLTLMMYTVIWTPWYPLMCQYKFLFLERKLIKNFQQFFVKLWLLTYELVKGKTTTVIQYTVIHTAHIASALVLLTNGPWLKDRRS